MGQWGREIQVGKARFLTHLETRNCFDPIRPGDPINEIVCLDDGGDPAGAAAALADIKAGLAEPVVHIDTRSGARVMGWL